jgi:hypothetical protein
VRQRPVSQNLNGRTTTEGITQVVVDLYVNGTRIGRDDCLRRPAFAPAPEPAPPLNAAQTAPPSSQPCRRRRRARNPATTSSARPASAAPPASEDRGSVPAWGTPGFAAGAGAGNAGAGVAVGPGVGEVGIGEGAGSAAGGAAAAGAAQLSP